MAIKTPIYRYFAPSSGSVFYYTDELPGDAINPSIIGFTGEASYIEAVIDTEIQPDAISNLSFWLDGETATVDAGVVSWTPKSGSSVIWANNTGNSIDVVNGQNFVDMPDGSTYMVVGLNGNYITTGSWHVFLVGQRDADSEAINTSWWFNHRLIGDAPGWWGVYHMNDGGEQINYGYSYTANQYRVTGPRPALNEPYLLEYYRTNAVPSASFRVNNGETAVASNLGVSISGLVSDFRVGEALYGSLAEVIIFSDQLSPEDQTGIRTYLGNKYGITVS